MGVHNAVMHLEDADENIAGHKHGSSLYCNASKDAVGMATGQTLKNEAFFFLIIVMHLKMGMKWQTMQNLKN